MPQTGVFLLFKNGPKEKKITLKEAHALESNSRPVILSAQILGR